MANTSKVFVLICFKLIVKVAGFAGFLNLPEGAPCEVDDYPGTCRLWKKCVTLVVDVKEKDYPPLCSFDGGDPIICCTSCNLTEDASKLVLHPKGGVFWKTNQTSWNKCIDYSIELPYMRRIYSAGTFDKEWNDTRQCFELDDDVIHGSDWGEKDASRAEFPHMALLGYGRTTNTSQWLCGGTLLNRRFMLTAGHCISKPDVGKVRFATLGLLKRSDPPERWQTYRIRRRIPHPEYRPPSKYHDIALLQTSRKISFNENSLPACLPNLAEKEDDDKALATATGWGIGRPGTELADTLQVVEVSKFSREKCSSLYGRHRLLRTGFNHDIQMCYGVEGHAGDTCEVRLSNYPPIHQGDSGGGPLQIWGQIYYLQRTVIGVTSYGPLCRAAGQAGVYTRVRPYVPWIDSIIWNAA